jgi:hypothetical protein
MITKIGMHRRKILINGELMAIKLIIKIRKILIEKFFANDLTLNFTLRREHW